MDILSNIELAVTFNHLVSGKVPGGFHALANLICASKHAWKVEQTHRYTLVCFEEYDELSRPPPEWFLARKGRIDHVEYACAADIEYEKDLQYMDTFLACGATVYLRTHKAFPHSNIVGASFFMYGFSWETDVHKFVEMLTNNPNLKIAIESYDQGGGGLEKYVVIRRITDALPLAPFSSRIDFSSFSMWVRNDAIGTWAQETFPSAGVMWANPAWLAYGVYTRDEVDSASEESADEEEEEEDESDEED